MSTYQINPLLTEIKRISRDPVIRAKFLKHYQKARGQGLSMKDAYDKIKPTSFKTNGFHIDPDKHTSIADTIGQQLRDGTNVTTVSILGL